MRSSLRTLSPLARLSYGLFCRHFILSFTISTTYSLFCLSLIIGTYVAYIKENERKGGNENEIKADWREKRRNDGS
jgi:hypothetical protein